MCSLAFSSSVVSSLISLYEWCGRYLEFANESDLGILVLNRLVGDIGGLGGVVECAHILIQELVAGR